MRKFAFSDQKWLRPDQTRQLQSSRSAFEQRRGSETSMACKRSLMTPLIACGAYRTPTRSFSRSVGQIPVEKLSQNDQDKLDLLIGLVQNQAKSFGFSTFPPSELSISEDSYRPEKEGFEIGFETSASDAIRLKWAYQLSLLELAKERPTNHPGVLVFDEPRQQSSSRPSFQNLLERAAYAKKRNTAGIVLDKRRSWDT